MPVVELLGAQNSEARSSYPGHCIHVILLLIINVFFYYISLRHCATSRKVAGSIPDGVSRIFIDIILPAALWPWV
jgi:hypothetical protein